MLLTNSTNFQNFFIEKAVRIIAGKDRGEDYQVLVELHEGDGMVLIDSQTIRPRTDLSEVFLDNKGAYALGTNVYITAINVEPTAGGGAGPGRSSR